MRFHLGKTLSVVKIKPLINVNFRIIFEGVDVSHGAQIERKSETLYQNYILSVFIVLR